MIVSARPPDPRRPPLQVYGLWFARRSAESFLVSDQDRETAAAQLVEQHAAGRLTLDELRERTEIVYGARTRGELSAALADLPGSAGPPGNPWEALVQLRSRNPFPGYGYARFWARAAGLWVDLILIAGLFLGLGPVAGAAHLAALTLLVPPAYFTAFWTALERTPGMWLVGAKVVRAEDGGRLGLRRSFVRSCGYLLDLASGLVGFGWAALDLRRQGWHDKLAGSLVVRRLR